MAIKFETPSRPGEARSRLGRWYARLGAGETMTREDIERDAAAQLGIPVGLLEQAAETVGQQRAAEHETGAHETGADETGEHGVAPTHGDVRRHPSLLDRLRGLVSPEPAAVRRERLEAEAAAELGLSDQHLPAGQ